MLSLTKARSELDDIAGSEVTPEYIDKYKEVRQFHESLYREGQAERIEAIAEEINRRLKASPPSPRARKMAKIHDRRYFEFFTNHYDAFRKKYPSYDVDFETFAGALLHHPIYIKFADEFFEERRK